MLCFGKENMGIGVNRIQIKHTIFLYACLLAGVMILVIYLKNSTITPKHETILKIRAAVPGGATPDGFFVLRNLDNKGIDFKSITLKKNILVLAFDEQAQSDAAKKELSKKLPKEFIIEQYYDYSEQPDSSWLDNKLNRWLNHRHKDD